MTVNLAMGLRADEARAILNSNGYTQEKYAYAGNACNDGSGYLYAATTLCGVFVGAVLEKVIQCSAVWINDPSSCEIEKPIIPVIGGFLGLCIPIYLLRKVDKNEISEAERINKLRKSVMEIIDENYQNCDFHRPLKGVHIAELLRLTDEKTQKQFLDLLNEAQIAQTLKDTSIYSSETLKNIQSRAKPTESLIELEWENKVESEIESWNNLRRSMINNEEGIGKAYVACKNMFGADIVDIFVKKHITNDNLKSVHKLSEHLAKSCECYYQNNRKEIDTINYFY
ncbi:MAG TPA: hypothetical protein PLC42_00155 [Parachlamydiaceae bacterium]|nr:hypothetical protein [Parachlamydiaceae bacterium]